MFARKLFPIVAAFSLLAGGCADISIDEDGNLNIVMGEEDWSDFEGYSSPAILRGEIETLAPVNTLAAPKLDSGAGYVEVIANVPEGVAMLIVFTPRMLGEMPVGTVLHQSYSGEETYIDVEQVPTTQIDEADQEMLEVNICGGDMDSEEDGDWYDVTAEEVVIEIKGTEDPEVNEVTIRAGATSLAGDFEVVTSTFTVNVVH